MTPWANAAINNELNVIREMPPHNINRPGSRFFISLLKLASVCVAGLASSNDVEAALRGACSAHDWIPQKEIEYQWRRALKRARPRHPQPQIRLPREPAAKSQPEETAVFNIIEIDLVNDRQRVLRTVSPAVVRKAEELAGMFANYLDTGELPTAVTFQKLEDAPGGVLLQIHFRRYSQALADCVLIACRMVGGFIMDDLQTGVFTVRLRTARFT